MLDSILAVGGLVSLPLSLVSLWLTIRLQRRETCDHEVSDARTRLLRTAYAAARKVARRGGGASAFVIPVHIQGKKQREAAADLEVEGLAEVDGVFCRVHVDLTPKDERAWTLAARAPF